MKSSLTFDDALRIARGCLDYGGGYRSDPALFEVYQEGIRTVICALESAQKTGLSDTQIRALHQIGGEQTNAAIDEKRGHHDQVRAWWEG